MFRKISELRNLRPVLHGIIDNRWYYCLVHLELWKADSFLSSSASFPFPLLQTQGWHERSDSWWNRGREPGLFRSCSSLGHGKREWQQGERPKCPLVSLCVSLQVVLERAPCFPSQTLLIASVCSPGWALSFLHSIWVNPIQFNHLETKADLCWAPATGALSLPSGAQLTAVIICYYKCTHLF